MCPSRSGRWASCASGQRPSALGFYSWMVSGAPTMFGSQAGIWSCSRGSGNGCVTVVLFNPEPSEIRDLKRVTLLSSGTHPPPPQTRIQPKECLWLPLGVIFLNSVSQGLVAQRLLQKLINFLPSRKMTGMPSKQFRWQDVFSSPR